MPERTEYTPGTFCWVELATTDAAAAKKFYVELFGWSPEDTAVAHDRVYTMFTHKNKSMGALYGLNEEQRSQGIPPHWGSYISVADVDETVEKAKSLGATVFAGPMEVFDAGRVAALQDPTGAFFAVWQPGKHIGAHIVKEAGTLCWNELLTNDVDKAGAFYTRLFGWSAETRQMGPIAYTSFRNGDRPAGGLMAIQKEWGEVPPNWMIYFAVDDCDAVTKKAISAGGTVLAEPCEIPEVGRFATLQDPQGAVFSVIKLATPVD